jgi:hypothetical protein
MISSVPSYGLSNSFGGNAVFQISLGFCGAACCFCGAACAAVQNATATMITPAMRSARFMGLLEHSDYDACDEDRHDGDKQEGGNLRHGCEHLGHGNSASFLSSQDSVSVSALWMSLKVPLLCRGAPFPGLVTPRQRFVRPGHVAFQRRKLISKSNARSHRCRRGREPAAASLMKSDSTSYARCRWRAGVPRSGLPSFVACVRSDAREPPSAIRTLR